MNDQLTIKEIQQEVELASLEALLISTIKAFDKSWREYYDAHHAKRNA